MKFIWEESDFAKESKNWGLMASRDDEIVIVGGKRCTSLRDGYSWEFENYEDMVKHFNENNYLPILAPVNPSVVIKAAMDKQFNYGRGI